MPTLQRKALRRAVGTRRLRETTIGATALSLGANTTLAVMDRLLALPDFSGQGMYSRAWVRVASVDYRVGSFNTGSGAFLGLALLVNAVASGADFEVHEKLSPAEIDAAIDETILSLHIRREVPIQSIDGKLFYTLDGAASPNRILSVLNAYYYADPASSLNRDRREFAQHAVVMTGSGLEFRPDAALGASQQIVLDALLQLTMGAGGDAATVNLPDEETVVWGAASRCLDLLIAQTPSAEAAQLERRRAEAVRMFGRLSTRYAPNVSKRLSFETPFTVELE